MSQNHVNREHLLRYKLSRLEDQYNLYWRQRAHANWLMKGDRNTKFFQAYASERRRKNIITRLRKEDGSVVEGEEALGNYIANHYKSLFTSSAGTLTDDLLSRVPTVVTPEMNARLIRPYSGEDVKKALESIGDLKAPRPDGMPAVFYKKFWELVGMKVQEEVLGVLNGNPMPESWNETTIVLIPKKNNPERITEFRPISLCNVLYKMISKVLANRLKEMLPKIISPTQSAFVPGRLITDNVLLAYAINHLLPKRKGGRDGFVAVKLDMSKAYDRVEWSFLAAMLCKLGFKQHWVDLIMKCVTSVRYQIKVNGALTQHSVRRGGCGWEIRRPHIYLLYVQKAYQLSFMPANGLG